MIASNAAAVEPLHEFFLASAGVAGALIGLLFVAISVTPHRVIGEGAEPAHRIRASSALTAFSNALTVSLFALIPSIDLGVTTIVVGVLGLLFVISSLLSVRRLRRDGMDVALRDVSFVIGQAGIFVGQIVAGARLAGSDQKGAVSTIAVLTVVCFLVGIGRAWELIGASTGRGLTGEMTAAIRERAHGDARAANADRAAKR